MERKRHRTAGQLTAIMLVLAAVVGLPLVASAATPSGNGFNACANKKSGALRLIDASKKQQCNKTTEIAVSWGKVGPAGAPGFGGATGVNGATGPHGVQGLQGVQGRQGPPGPSDVWSSSGSAAGLSGGFSLATTVTSVTVPAGTYLVEYSVGVHDGTLSRETSCAVQVGTGTLVGMRTTVPKLATTLQLTYGSIAATFVQTTNATGALTLKCSSRDGGVGVTGELAALPVGASH